MIKIILSKMDSNRILLLALVFILLSPSSCDRQSEQYLNFRTPGEVQAGGVRMIELKEGYKVWTKRFGNSPMKVLLLHGGPAATHEYMECFESFFPQADIEFYHYDQLGSYYSEQPDENNL